MLIRKIVIAVIIDETLIILKKKDGKPAFRVGPYLFITLYSNLHSCPITFCRLTPRLSASIFNFIFDLSDSSILGPFHHPLSFLLH